MCNISRSQQPISPICFKQPSFHSDLISIESMPERFWHPSKCFSVNDFKIRACKYVYFFAYFSHLYLRQHIFVQIFGPTFVKPCQFFIVIKAQEISGEKKTKKLFYNYFVWKPCLNVSTVFAAYHQYIPELFWQE